MERNALHHESDALHHESSALDENRWLLRDTPMAANEGGRTFATRRKIQSLSPQLLPVSQTTLIFF